MEHVVKDFCGNELKAGDKIVVTDKTYSKTPLLVTGTIKKIEHRFNKNNEWTESLIHFKIMARSDQYLTQLEADNYDYSKCGGWYGEEEVYFINKSKYISILKIN